MGYIYKVPYTGTLTSAGGNTTVLEVRPAAEHPLKLAGFRIGVTSELGDAADENLLLAVRHFAATLTGSDGTAVTPVKTNVTKDPAASFAAECNGPTVATTSGANTVVEYLVVNVRANPTEFWWAEEKVQQKYYNAETLIIQLETAVTDDVTIAITAFIEEE